MKTITYLLWIVAALASLTGPARPAAPPASDPNLADPVAQVLLRGNSDPAYRGVAQFYPPMRSPREIVGVPTHPDTVGVDSLGRLQLITTTEAPSAPTAWLEIGSPPAALGAGTLPLKRRLLDGHLPVVVLSGTRNRVAFEQTVFGWSRGFRPDAELYAYVRLRLSAPAGTALPPRVFLAERLVTPRGFGFAPNQNLIVALAPARAAARERDYTLRIPCRRPGQWEPVSEADYLAALTQTRQFWHATLSAGTMLDLPEARVNDAWKAWLAYSLLNIHRVKGYDEPHDGSGFYQAMYGYSAMLYCIALDRYGHHAQARRCLDAALHAQQPDGLYIQNFGLPDQGALLTALAEHYRLTGDRAWLRSVAPAMIRAGDWIIRRRAISPKTGIAANLIKYQPYCDFPLPAYDYFSDVYCCTGLEKAAGALGAIGMTADARRFGDEAAQYRAALLRSMDQSVFRHNGTAILPIEPETHRVVKESNYHGGEYYGLVASNILETGFLAPNDRRARLFTDFMQKDGGLYAGVCRFDTGIDHAYSYGYLLTLLKRRDARRFLLGFYGMLAYGMTRDTYSGVETTNLFTGENAATLPHLYSCTMQLLTLQAMLVRADSDALLLGEAIPRAWLADGKHVAVHNMQTRFGTVSYQIVSHVRSGMIEVRLSPPRRSPPRHLSLRLRAPAGRSLRAVLVNGHRWQRFSGEVIRLDGLTEPCVIKALYSRLSARTAL